MTDLMAYNIPNGLLKIVFMKIRNKNPDAKFLLMTKVPMRYSDFRWEFGREGPEIILGATIETDLYVFRDVPNGYQTYAQISECPESPNGRLKSMESLSESVSNKLFISVEPILDFSDKFVQKIIKINPSMVAVGMDNYGWHLPEPSLEKIERLIEDLEREGILVFRKSLRKAWYDN